MNEDRVTLTVLSGPTGEQGRRLQTWTTYSVTEDLFQPANSASFTLAANGAGTDLPAPEYVERVSNLTLPDAVIALELDGIRLATMIIVDQFWEEGENGEAMIHVEALDPAHILMENEVPRDLNIDSQTTLPSIAEKICAKYRGHGIDFEISADDVANRSLLSGKVIASTKTVRTSRGTTSVASSGVNEFFIRQSLEDAQPHPGETEWDFIHRHAENLGVIPYFTADGNFCFTVPDYDQEELYAIRRILSDPDRTNILRGGRRRSATSTATEVEVLGRGSLYHSADPRSTTRRKTKKKSAIRGYAKTAADYTWPRRRYVIDHNPVSNEQADRIAKRILAHRNANSEVYEYTVAGHRSKRGYVYTVNTLCHIRDERIKPIPDLSGFITKRVLDKSRSDANAATTALTLVPKGSIML